MKVRINNDGLERKAYTSKIPPRPAPVASNVSFKDTFKDTFRTLTGAEKLVQTQQSAFLKRFGMTNKAPGPLRLRPEKWLKNLPPPESADPGNIGSILSQPVPRSLAFAISRGLPIKFTKIFSRHLARILYVGKPLGKVAPHTQNIPEPVGEAYLGLDRQRISKSPATQRHFAQMRAKQEILKKSKFITPAQGAVGSTGRILTPELIRSVAESRGIIMKDQKGAESSGSQVTESLWSKFVAWVKTLF